MIVKLIIKNKIINPLTTIIIEVQRTEEDYERNPKNSCPYMGQSWQIS